MKNPVTILLISLHVVAYMNIVEVLKFPNLIKHYHKQHLNDESVGFIAFLNMHYIKCNDGDKTDDREDMKLPFKNIEFHILAQAVIANYFAIVLAEKDNSTYDLYYNHNCGSIPSIHSTSLFRPPILIT